ncbi:CTP synthase [bacterium]|jgi:CTP synthase|nr:CTP synthase [bacterium]MBT4251406.1 CTP synthase [bacterium]MBT4598142.1 CTP synthase [bacterium]MBT6754357.1 CTP synthase [bacterium]MBT7037280.1 CTP synthase [bacterium]
MENKNWAKDAKFIFVFGGVMSGIGKGVSASSIAKIIQARGYSVTAVKIDPYVNVDAGTMNPTEHGETFVLSSGLETDQDMGNYERFLNVKLPPTNYMTTGSIYQKVIERERNLEYKGTCVQIIPHVTNEVIETLEKAAENNKADFVIIEVGGTTGDYENMLFTEAARLLKLQRDENSVLYVTITYVPYPEKTGEMKTKPTQQAIRSLNSAGIQTDIIIARSSVPIDKKRKEKIALFCNIKEGAVISAPDIESIYDVPLNFEKDNLSELILQKLGIEAKKSDLSDWEEFIRKMRNATEEIKIGIVGKYFGTGECVLSDAYISVIEAVKHAAIAEGRKAKIEWLSAEEYEQHPEKLEKLRDYAGIIVPGGFGERGIEGKIATIKFVRENKIPYLGLCYGMQLLVVEYARNVLGLLDANTVEIDSKTLSPIIDIMPDQKNNITNGNYGATMRLGDYPCKIKEGTLAFEAYGETMIKERHRHRYEVNPAYIERLEEAGLIFSGVSPNGTLMEIAELPKDQHPCMFGSQFHPELTSSPLHPSPMFLQFIKIAKERN